MNSFWGIALLHMFATQPALMTVSPFFPAKKGHAESAMIEDTLEFLHSLLQRGGLPSEFCVNEKQPEVVSQIGSRSAKVTRGENCFVVKTFESPLVSSVCTSNHEQPWQAFEAVAKWVNEEQWG